MYGCEVRKGIPGIGIEFDESHFRSFRSSPSQLRADAKQGFGLKAQGQCVQHCTVDAATTLRFDANRGAHSC